MILKFSFSDTTSTVRLQVLQHHSTIVYATIYSTATHDSYWNCVRLGRAVEAGFVVVFSLLRAEKEDHVIHRATTFNDVMQVTWYTSCDTSQQLKVCSVFVHMWNTQCVKRIHLKSRWLNQTLYTTNQLRSIWSNKTK